MQAVTGQFNWVTASDDVQEALREVGLVQCLDLLAGEEIGVARDDRRLLGDLLLPYTNRAALFGALVVVVAQPRLVLVLRRAPPAREPRSPDARVE